MNRKGIIQKKFSVIGMSCAACSARVERTLNKQAGVCQAAVNLATATATVEYDTRETSPQALQEAIQKIGFELVIQEDSESLKQVEENQETQYRALRFRTLWAIVLSVPIMVISMFFMHMPYANFIMWALATPVVFWLGRGFFINAWKLLRHGGANMDTLVANSTGIAYLFSLFNMLFPEYWTSKGIEPHVYFEASSVIIAFILLGRLLEAKAKGNTSSAIKKLMRLQPQTVIRITTTGQEEEIAIADIHKGDCVLVKPGERIAVDGIVTEGNSYVDESMLSGEPMAVRKEPGATVFAGTINQKGSFRFCAQKVGSDTLLAKIIRMVQDAQGSKAPIQRLVDKIAAIFVPTIMVIACLAFLIWLLWGGENGLTQGLLAAVTVLIIACPCALGLATPTAIMVGIGKGAECGILVKDAESLEIGKRIDTVVLDKTGTITQGKPVVSSQILPHGREIFSSWGRNIFLVEKLSEHPLATAITSYLEHHIDYRNAEEDVVTNFESITGLGVKGEVNGKTYYAGCQRLLERHAIPLTSELLQEAQRLTAEAQTVVWMADEEQVLGLIAINDPIKSHSAKSIGYLQQQGIEVHLLTGDNQATAKEIARQTGIKHYQAEVLPQEKAAYIKRLQQAGRKVAMIGDGINDSAALAQADLSIAMGNGSDIAMDVAQMTIISSDLNKIAEALRLSHLTVRTIRQNLFWAFIYNIIGVPIAAGVLYPFCGFLLNPMIAGAAMAFSSVSVVTNSLRLKLKKVSRS